MISPVATWAWVEQSSQQEICQRLYHNNIIDDLAQEIINTRQPITYRQYSKLFSLFYVNLVPPSTGLKIEHAMQSINLFEKPKDNDYRNVNQLIEYIQAHATEKAIGCFMALRKCYGFEEVCVHIFEEAVKYELVDFIDRALATLSSEHQKHILTKCVMRSAENRNNQAVCFWLSKGAPLDSCLCMEKTNAEKLKTTSSVKNLFHVAVLTENFELAVILINAGFDIRLLGDFNPLNFFIAMHDFSVVEAYVEKYGIVQTYQAPLAEANYSALLTHTLNTIQLLSHETQCVCIMKAIFASGFAPELAYTLLEQVAKNSNGHAFLTLLKALGDEKSMILLAKLFRSVEDHLEDVLMNLLAVNETKRQIFTILMVIADAYKIPCMAEILICLDYSADNLLKNALETHAFTEEFLLEILNIIKKNAFQESIVRTVPLIMNAIKRRLTQEEMKTIIAISRFGQPSIFHALMQKEMPYRTNPINNLLDITLQYFHCGGTILLLLRNGFLVENCGAKLLLEAIYNQDELLLEQAIIHGAGIETTLINGIDPLSFAILMNKTYAVKMLLQAGRSPDKVLFRPSQDGAEDGTLKPVELAIRHKKFSIVRHFFECSDEMRNNILQYQAIVAGIFECDKKERKRKQVLAIIFRDFPFAVQALEQGPLKDFSKNLLKALRELKTDELRKIESNGRSIFEIPWLLNSIHRLGVQMLRVLTPYQCIFSLENLHSRLGAKASIAFHHLLGIDTHHYHTVTIEPILEEMISPDWTAAVDYLMTVANIPHPLWSALRRSKGILPHGVLDSPEEAVNVFMRRFDAAFLLNELAEILRQLRNKSEIVAEIELLFTGGNIPTCFNIHLTVLHAGCALYHQYYRDYVNKNEIYRDENRTYTAEEICQGASRIFLYTLNRDSYIGTPAPKTAAIEEFYAVIRQSILQMLRWLEKNKDHDARLHCITDFGMAGNRCGSRWLGCLHQQLNFLKGKNAQYVDIIQELYASLQNDRERIVNKIIHHAHDDVHLHNHAYKLLGPMLGLPGADIFTNNVDNLISPEITANKLLSLFNSKYDPIFILGALRKFLTESYSKPEKRDLLTLWIRSNLCDEMDGHIYLPMIEAVTKAVSSKRTRKEIEPLMKDVYWNQEEPNPLKAIQDKRFQEFIEEVVLNENGQFRMAFMIYMALIIRVLSKPREQLTDLV